jgi:hypothetical protein
MSDYRDQLNHVADVLDQLCEKRELLAARSQELEAAGITDAKPYWRKRKGKASYLYLVPPMVDGVRPKQEYVGADPEKQQEALARVERFEQRQALQRDLATLDEQIARIKWRVADLDHLAESAEKIHITKARGEPETCPHGEDPVFCNECRGLYDER